jgi:hypothetical protein
VFQSCAKIQISNGLDVMFWWDIWIDGRSVPEIALLVVMQVTTRIKNKRRAAEALPHHVWVQVSGDTDGGRVRTVCQALDRPEQLRSR